MLRCPVIKALSVGQVEVMLMLMYDENGMLIKDHTRLVAVRCTRIGRDMSFQAVRRRYTDGDAPGGSLMYKMHWGELPMAGYVVMRFQDFRKAVQLQKVRRNGKAMIEILITRPDEYNSIGDGGLDEGLVLISLCDPMPRNRLRGTSGTGCETTQVGT